MSTQGIKSFWNNGFDRDIDENRLLHAAKRDINELIEKVERYEEFIGACRFAGEGGLPQLRKEANHLLSDGNENRVMELNKILRK